MVETVKKFICLHFASHRKDVIRAATIYFGILVDERDQCPNAVHEKLSLLLRLQTRYRSEVDGASVK